MKSKYIYFFLGLFLLAVAGYLLMINLSNPTITGAVVSNNEDKPQQEQAEQKKLPKDCFELNDGRMVCKLGKTKVKAGEVEDKTYKVK